MKYIDTLVAVIGMTYDLYKTRGEILLATK